MRKQRVAAGGPRCFRQHGVDCAATRNKPAFGEEVENDTAASIANELQLPPVAESSKSKTKKNNEKMLLQ